MKVIDLSRTLGGPDHCPIPGHPSVDYQLLHTHEVHGRTNATLKFSIHEGTHIDPPYHFLADGETIDEIPVDTLIAPGFLFRLGPVNPGEAITLARVLQSGSPPANIEGYIVIIDGLWGEKTGANVYYNGAPYLAQDLADWLIANKVRALGLTNPPDKVEGARKGDAPIHRSLLGNGVLIIENLTNLDAIPNEDFVVVALPLKISRGCGGPTRVVAVVGDGFRAAVTATN
jgi:arylformamidase